MSVSQPNRTRPAEASYALARTDHGWRVTFGNFAWDFDSWPAACEHALECARLYATVSGRCTSVSVPGAHGESMEVRRYAGVLRLPVAFRWPQALGERRA
jgi:hypothetical protein